MHSVVERAHQVVLSHQINYIVSKLHFTDLSYVARIFDHGISLSGQLVCDILITID